MERAATLQMDTIIRVTLIAGLIYWSFQLVQPFIGFLLWGFILAVALYPIYNWLRIKLHGHAKIAAFITVLLSLLIVVGAVFVLADNLISTVNFLIHKVKDNEQLFPTLPDSIVTIPFIGEKIQNIWTTASTNLSEVISQYSNYILSAGGFAVGKAVHKGIELILFIFSVLFAGYILICSEKIVSSVRMLAMRISPERGENYVAIMKDTVQNVSRGVIGIAIIQSLLFGILLLIAKVPGAGLISFVGLILCIAQIGLLPLVIPVIIWMFYTKTFAFALVITIFMLLVGLIDNALKPFLLCRGLQTPVVIILFA